MFAVDSKIYLSCMDIYSRLVNPSDTLPNSGYSGNSLNKYTFSVYKLRLVSTRYGKWLFSMRLAALVPRVGTQKGTLRRPLGGTSGPSPTIVPNTCKIVGVSRDQKKKKFKYFLAKINW